MSINQRCAIYRFTDTGRTNFLYCECSHMYKTTPCCCDLAVFLSFCCYTVFQVPVRRTLFVQVGPSVDLIIVIVSP